jgi:hypothetical protein
MIFIYLGSFSSWLLVDFTFISSIIFYLNWTVYMYFLCCIVRYQWIILVKLISEVL